MQLGLNGGILHLKSDLICAVKRNVNLRKVADYALHRHQVTFDEDDKRKLNDYPAREKLR